MSAMFGLKKVGKYWHAEFRVGNERIHRSTGALTKDDALAVAEKWYRQLSMAAKGVRIDTEDTVEELFEAWDLKTKCLHSSSHHDRVTQDWRLHILPLIGTRPAKSINNADVGTIRRTFLEGESLRNVHLAKKIAKNRAEAEAKAKARKKPAPKAPAAPATRSVTSSNKLLAHLRLVYIWAVDEEELLTVMPFRIHFLKSQEKAKTRLAQDQIRPFLKIIDHAENPHVKVAVRAMLYLGLRECEALTLRWEWFGPDLATFTHQDTKGKEAVPLPVPVDLQAWLKTLKPEVSGLVLPADDGAPHRQQFTKKAIMRAGVLLGLPGLTPHSLRGSCATMMAQKGIGAHVIQKALRHKHLETSLEYVQINTRDIAEAQAAVFGDLARPVSQKSHNIAGKFTVKLREKRSYTNSAKTS